MCHYIQCTSWKLELCRIYYEAAFFFVLFIFPTQPKYTAFDKVVATVTLTGLIQNHIHNKFHEGWTISHSSDTTIVCTGALCVICKLVWYLLMTYAGNKDGETLPISKNVLSLLDRTRFISGNDGTEIVTFFEWKYPPLDNCSDFSIFNIFTFNEGKYNIS